MGIDGEHGRAMCNVRPSVMTARARRPGWARRRCVSLFPLRKKRRAAARGQIAIIPLVIDNTLTTLTTLDLDSSIASACASACGRACLRCHTLVGGAHAWGGSAAASSSSCSSNVSLPKRPPPVALSSRCRSAFTLAYRPGPAGLT
jgi:hypothetical protein